ncbi:MAG: efflux RND transporter permease subunit [Clostridiales bacterium]|nr:efflux RND transporter permease subunit [Clostridiales bacterium]
MLSKVSKFIVEKRYIILAVMLIVAIASIFMMQQVEINEDMTKYLPDDSSMKMGLDIMTEEFPDMETSQTIRVMFDDLTGEQKNEVLKKLEAIPYVDSVAYEAESEDYNKDNHTLFVLNTKYDYKSAEELSIETALNANFTEYSIEWHNDDTSMPDIPAWIIAAALVILLVILFAMCGSWIEPILFIVVIGIAIVINMGTNIIMGSVSSVTFSIAAILQLVLSMDYSIILINRYRQEKEKIADKNLAMREALAHAFSSIASSSLTTVVGLLMLVFMSFKIGMDLGIVLAKGVFISMVCVLIMLPGIILACDKLIQKTAKKELHIPMEWAAKLSYRFRHALGIIFILLFAGVYMLQTQTGIAYVLQKEDMVADIFPATNTLVMVYENEDENAIEELTSWLEKDEKVKSVMSYFTMLEKPYHFTELADEITDMGGDMVLDESVIKMLYYDYFTDSDAETAMTAADFLNFISENIATNETFSDYIGEDLLENMDMIKKFSDANTLTTPMNAEELGAFFDMDENEIADLFLYYYIQNGGVDTGSMTLPAFADFVINEVAADKTYGSMFDEAALSQMNQLAVFTDKGKMTSPYDSKGIASVLGMDETMVQQVFTMYYGTQSVNQGIPFTAFTNFLVNNVLQNPAYSSLFDETSKAQLIQMNELANAAAGGQMQTAAQPSQIVDLAVSGQELTYTQLAACLGIEETQVRQLFVLYWGQDVSGKKLTVQQTINFILSDDTMSATLDMAAKGQLQMAQTLINGSVNGTAYSSDSLANLMGMEKSQADQLYLLYISRHGDTSDWKLTVKDFIDFINGDILNNPDFSELFDEETANMLSAAKSMVDAVISGKQYTAAEMNEMFAGVSDDLDSDTMKLMYLYAAADKADLSAQTMSIETLFDYLVNDVLNDTRFTALIDDEMRDGLYEAKDELEEGKEQLVSEKYARMIINTGYAEESPETTAFLSDLMRECSENLSGDVYFIGNSVMNYEMQQIFDSELLFITLLVAIAIFLIVALTFKSIFIPLILVLVVQCGVYATISVIGLQGDSIYYLALLIVECILMGATIDYGILFTNYYCENRKTLPIKEALTAAYTGSTHTILTSGLILILVTAIVGNFFAEPTVSAIVKTVSIGALCATLLILFVLPGVLAVCDRLIIRKKQSMVEKQRNEI